MDVIEVPVSDIKVNFRLRNPSEDKVHEIAESIDQIGLISPITIDTDKNLLAGFHRLLSYKQLQKETIPAIIKDADSRYGELIEVDENLKRNDLNHIEVADHIIRREELLDELGLTYKAGDNQVDVTVGKLTIKDIASGIGYSKRQYQMRKQVANIHPEVKSLLSDTEFADSLTDLVKLSSESDATQLAICNLLISGRCNTFKAAFIQGKYSEFKLKSPPTLDFNVKDRFGDYPQSIMKFSKVNDDLKRVCDLVNHDDHLRVQKGSLNFGETKIKLHQMSTSYCQFAIEYYTQPNDVICDPFNGRGTTGITALHTGRKYKGFEINPYALKRTKEVIQKHIDVPQDHWEIHQGCGCEMKELKDKSECIDSFFTSPPYYGSPEPYNSLDGDLSNMSMEDFDNKIDIMFGNMSRLIKKSDYKNKIFHPIIIVVGTWRDRKNGIQDMDSSFQYLAKRHGLTLWDKLFTATNNPHLICSIRRNYEWKFVHKNYETQLVWVKF